MQMRALTAAARTICYATAVALDVSVRATDAKVRSDAAARGALLTPIAKAFSTDIGNEVTSLGVQVHGGMGFIEETGAAQHYRDARITSIYEGTNGIQSIDLVTRKLAANGGACGLGPARRTHRDRHPGRDLERSGVRHHRRQTARRARTRSTAPAAGCWSASPRRRTKRWPARRPICGCSDRRSAAACWPAKRSPRAISARRRRSGALRHAGEILCRKHLGAGGRAGAHRDGQRRSRERRRCGVAGVGLPRCALRSRVPAETSGRRQ